MKFTFQYWIVFENTCHFHIPCYNQIKAVFYNGDEKQPEQYELKLSDAYEHRVENPEIELTCKVYNINYGKNCRLLENCKFLKDYMTFVDYVRNNHKDNGYDNLEHCIDMAIDRCVEEDVLRDFLIRRRMEVVKVMKLDYTFDRQLMLEREDSREEGLEEGRKEGRKKGREEGIEEGRKEGRKKGREEGIEEGRKEGRLEGRLEGSIFTLYELGYTVPEIAEKLKQDEESVLRILDTMN